MHQHLRIEIVKACLFWFLIFILAVLCPLLFSLMGLVDYDPGPVVNGLVNG